MLPVLKMARLAGLEPATLGLEGPANSESTVHHRVPSTDIRKVRAVPGPATSRVPTNTFP